MKPRLVSVVVPAYNEEDVLPAFHERMSAVLDKLAVESEIIFVNDGSTDDTLNVLKSLQNVDDRIAVIDLSRNYGKEIALTAGLDHVRSDAELPVGELLTS